MRKILIVTTALLFTTSLLAQFTPSPPEDTTKAKQLEEVVITGQYKPQSVKNSVYQVRVINNERIRLSGATNVQQVLNNQLGFRFSNDNTLGVSDVSLAGMSGRNIKILLDGIPLTDRNDARESINQIDINTIERIEIVDGPMSVSYGSDALAGVINIITQKNTKEHISVFAKAQEETAGREYYPGSYKGVHAQNVGINFKKKTWHTSVGGTHNDFDGFGGDEYGRGKTWRPKEQWMGYVKGGYSNNGFDIYYRLDGLKETITDRETINMLTYRAINKKYGTDRFIHQLQSAWHINNRSQVNTILSYTDYKRKTTTAIHDFEKNTDALSTADGEQDLAKLNSFIFRSTMQYQACGKLSFQPGIEIQREAATSGRIEGRPVITDYAVFVSSEIKPTGKINIRPGLRFIHNSTYDAPPVVPSLNTKFV
ncbi:MAG: TonB-dependent receptor plug domain-containing protein, partial [Bacteroidota bacterium]